MSKQILAAAQRDGGLHFECGGGHGFETGAEPRGDHEQKRWARICDRIVAVLCCDAAGRRVDCSACGNLQGGRCSKAIEGIVEDLAVLVAEAQRCSEDARRLRALLARALDHVPGDHPLADEGMAALN